MSYDFQYASLSSNLKRLRHLVADVRFHLHNRRHIRARDDIRHELAAARFQTALISHAYISGKAGFRDDQPRWPEGTPGEPKPGGRWSGGAGSAPPSNERSANPKSRGHHYVPRQLFDGEPLKPETRAVFERATTGPIPGPPHRFGAEHITYNQVVKEAFDKFKADNGIARSEDVTPHQAEKFLEKVKQSPDPRIYNLNRKIIMRQVRYYMRGFRVRSTE